MRVSTSSWWCCTDRKSHQGVTWGIFLRELHRTPTRLELLHISSATTYLLLVCQQSSALGEFMGSAGIGPAPRYFWLACHA